MYQVASKSTSADFHQLVSGEISVLRQCYRESLSLSSPKGCRPGHEQWLALQECTNTFVR